MRMSEKCCNSNNSSDNPLTSRRTDGGKNGQIELSKLKKIDMTELSKLFIIFFSACAR